MTKESAVKVRKMLISPQIAEEWLGGMAPNRPLNDPRMVSYAADMADDRWQDNGECIKLLKDGRVCDGQKRLQAVILNQKSMWLWVAQNLSHTVMPTLDSGQTRTLANQVSIAGRSKHASTLAGALRQLWGHQHGDIRFPSHGKVPPTNQQLFDLLDENPGINKSTEYAHSEKGWKFLALMPSTIAFLHFSFTKKNATTAVAFLDAIRDGEGLRKGQPEWILRKKLMENAQAQTRLPSRTTKAFIIKTWNAIRAERKLSVLRFGNTEPFPVIR